MKFNNHVCSQGYGRKGSALYGLQRLEEAEKAYAEGLKVEPENAMLKKGMEDVNNALNDPLGGAGGNPFASMFQGDILSKLAANPKTSQFLSDPEFVQKLLALQKDPKAFGQ